MRRVGKYTWAGVLTAGLLVGGVLAVPATAEETGERAPSDETHVVPAPPAEGSSEPTGAAATTAPAKRDRINASEFIEAEAGAEVLHVKLVDGLAPEFIDVLVGSGGAEATPLFDRPSPVLDEERRAAEAATGIRQVDLATWFRVDAGTTRDGARLLERLNAHPSVEAALPEPHLAPAGAFQLSPNFEPDQRYRDAAPVGVDADYAIAIPGGTGAGVTITDIEYSWNTGHEDLADTVGTEIANGTPEDPFDDTDHGTAVLGIIAGEANGFGVTGLVPDATPQLVNAYTAEGQDLTNAIDVAAANSIAGDIILIEQQLCPVPIIGGVCAPGWLPVEWFPSYYDAITAAVNQGIHVIQAGGNGGRNIDDQLPFDDSGSIIVGAGNPVGCTSFGPEPANGRLDFSNYGERIDVQSHGACVWTTGSEGGGTNADDSLSYTGSFNGTSSASAIVAGAAASLASAAKVNGTPLAPNELRALLRSTGTPQDTTIDGRPIGPQPDLRAAIDAMLAGAVEAPPNDDFVAATPVMVPSSTTQGTDGATVQVGEPTGTCGFPDSTVWFEVSVPVDTRVRLSVQRSGGAPAVAVWRTASGGLLEEVACSSSAGADVATHLTLRAGERYLIQVGNTGGLAITLDLQEVSCDINGDGVSDALVGLPGETIGGNEGAGAINVLFGDPDLFDDPSALRAQAISQASPGIKGAAEADDRFGASLACGDVNGDGFDDAIVGIPGEDRGGTVDSGAIQVLFGSPTGFDTGEDQLISQATGSVPGGAEANDLFGSDVALGDVNGDGYADVVIAAVGEAIGRRTGAGWTVVLDGGPDGVDTSGGTAIHQNAPGQPGTAERNDAFGSALAVADTDRDGFDDIAIGVAGEGLAGFDRVGAVSVLRGAPGGVDLTSARWIAPTASWFGVAPAADLALGGDLTFGDTDADGDVDLVVGGAGDTGRVVVVAGTPSGLGFTTTVIDGDPVEGDVGFAVSVAAGDIDADGGADLLVGTPGSTAVAAAAGTFSQLGFDASGDLAARAAFSQDSPSVAGAAEEGDRFGAAVLLRDLDDDGYVDAVVGAPNERLKGDDDAGMVVIVPGGPTGLEFTRDKSVSQATPGVAGAREPGDLMGSSLG